jgi:TonB family protein
MKTKLILSATLVCVAACSLFGSPTPTVKNFMEAAKTGDAESMTKLFSSRAIQRDGIEKTNANNKNFANLIQRAASRKSYEMVNIKESTSGNNARVAFHYQSSDRLDSIRLVFALTKEDGTWKIDNIGGSKLESIADLASPELKDPPVKKAPAEGEPSPVDSPSQTAAPPTPTTPGSPIDGGVLNQKALTLPQPAYPAIGRSVHAGGKVVVQVIVDENGNVTDAVPIVGHPLLRAAAANAARAAKFPPAKDAGQPAKVKGVIHYNFDAQ